MSNQSGTSSQVISLPNGGGALSGIGETFSPDLHSGTGNFSVPIALPPGRGSFQPALNLVYSTGNAGGPFGVGWRLSVPGVTRKTSKGVPRYDDKRDTFILSGAEDLVPVETAEGWTRYRPRTEGLFARIYHHRTSDNDYWEVQSRDGLVSRYGTPRPPGADGTWQDPAVLADPASREKVFAWSLTETLDSFGNRIVYTHERDTGEAGPHHWNQLYLRQIRYVDFEDAQGTEQFLVSVTFEYQDLPERYDPGWLARSRLYPFSDYRAGFEVRTRRRCKRILVRTHAGQERLVRTYELVYLDERVTADELPEMVLPHNGASLLSEIRVVGYDESQAAPDQHTQELPPLEFAYTPFAPEGRDFLPLEGRDLPAQSLASPDLELADLFGNGLPDILEMNGTVRYWRNLGGGRFDVPRPMRDAPAGLQLADPGVQLIDANGDGRIDLLVSTNGLHGYFPLLFNGEWDRRSFQRYRQAPSFNLQDPEVQLVDLDGDGVTDAIRSGTRLECYFNDPEEGWNGTRHVERRVIEDFPNVPFSDPRVRWADMSGDGLQDIVLVYDGNVEYWPNLGRGNWGRRIHMHDSPRFPYGYDPRRILIGDVDGDGLADLVYVDHCKVLLWINQSGNGWSDPVEIDGTPPVSDLTAVRLVDLLGTGINGVLWSTDANGLTRSRMFFLDFTGGLKPYLLHEMNNHLGAVTRIGYAPSTRFYLEDQRRPETRWQTPLPFPVQVVACVEVIDELSRGKLTTEYRYHHGYWDGAEREFRGFGMVEQLDTETFERYNTPGLHGEEMTFTGVDTIFFSPPTLTRTWFHQGPIGEATGEWHEADYSGEYWRGDPPLLGREDNVTVLLRTLPRRARRDALRALRGRILRTELYALDGTERQIHPYTVSESRYGLREESPPGFGEDRLRIFFPHQTAQRTTQWERGDEPMTRFSFTEDYDAYGQARSQINIAVPRWRRSNLEQENQVPSRVLPAGTPAYILEHARRMEQYLATQTITEYAQRDSGGVYITDRVASTTTYEILNSGREGLFELKESISNGTAPRAIIDHTLSFFDGPAFRGLPYGQLGDHGALVRTETLVLTPEILREAYRSGDRVLDPPEEPPYLAPDGVVTWPAEYPQDFRDRLPALAGYTYHDGRAGTPYERGYYAPTKRCEYDFQRNRPGARRGLLVTTRDPFGNDTTIAYDRFDLLPERVTDPVGLTTTASYDYRVFQPYLVTDPNGNRQAFGYTPLGLPAWIAVMGKEGENVGDTPEVPGIRFEYDLMAFENSPPGARLPVFVRTVRRTFHAQSADVPQPERVETITTVVYSDGFGQVLQTRTQAEDTLFGDVSVGNVLPADMGDLAGTRADVVGRTRGVNDPVRVAVSGWQTYDNKGRVVEKYEPFFSTGWDFAPQRDAERGQRITMYYDPRGQITRTVHPDGSEQRVIYGIPESLSDPSRFTPTAWEAYTYDENDNASRTHHTETQAYQDHWDTPVSIALDALGRTVESVERNGQDPVNTWYVTRSTYDIRGNQVQVIDPLGRRAFHATYDLANRTLRDESIDAGSRRLVLNAAGNEVERRDGNGAFVLQAYDLLRRPIRLWARDDDTSNLSLREWVIFGDGAEAGLTAEAAARSNLLGRVYQYYDEAGRVTFERYDFKGNVEEKIRNVISTSAVLAVFDPPRPSLPRRLINVFARRRPPPDRGVQAFRIDWQPPQNTTLADAAALLLDPFEYRTSARYDALNRITVFVYPEDVEGGRRTLRTRYNHAGAIEQIEVDGTAFVAHVAYNARGQRTLVVYGNRVMIRYAYDPETFRLVRLRTEHITRLAPFTYRPTGAPLQDFGYRYDLAGNITSLFDRTPGGGIPNTLDGSDALDRSFSYDPLYRLLSATGRECDVEPDRPPWDDRPRCTDVTRVREYAERYEYDPAGNLTRLQHTARNGSFTRVFVHDPASNRIDSVTSTNGFSRRYTYASDASGNLVQENTERHFEWDHSGRMKAYRVQVGSAEPSLFAHYLYDANGQRIKKLVRLQGGDYEVTVYIDGLFERHLRVQGNTRQEHDTLHLRDGTQRVATIRVGAPFPEDNTPAIQYHAGDHLGSSNLTIDDTGGWINREEYTPYGETSFGSFSRKRYRFTGKERDEESGLYYFGARFYAPWLARWVSCDPLGMVEQASLYTYARNRPIRFTDQIGLNSDDPPDNPAVRGAVTERAGNNLLTQKGQQTILGKQVPVGESRLDTVLVSKEGDRLAHSVDMKQLDVSRDKYRLAKGGLSEAAVRNRAKAELKESTKKHVDDIRKALDEGKELAPGYKTRVNETVLFEVRGAKKGEVAKIRKIVQEVKIEEIGRGQGIGAGVVEEIKERTTHETLRRRNGIEERIRITKDLSGNVLDKKIIPRPSRAGFVDLKLLLTGAGLSGLGILALKVVPFIGIGAGITSATYEASQGNYGTAILDLLGLVPVYGDLLDLTRLVWNVFVVPTVDIFKDLHDLSANGYNLFPNSNQQ